MLFLRYKAAIVSALYFNLPTGLATTQGQDKHENMARAKWYRFATTRDDIQGYSRFCGGTAGKLKVFKFQVRRRSMFGPLFTSFRLAVQRRRAIHMAFGGRVCARVGVCWREWVWVVVCERGWAWVGMGGCVWT